MRPISRGPVIVGAGRGGRGRGAVDDDAFDQFVRRFGVTGSRRAVIPVLVAGLLPTVAGAAARRRTGDGGRDDGTGGANGRGGGRRSVSGRAVAPEGCLKIGTVCFTTGPRAKRCTNCCSGFATGRRKLKCACKPTGRRCGKPGECCSADCQGGTCQPSLVATGKPCTIDGVGCANARAKCITYEPGSGGPDGLRCLLPAGESCSADAWCSNFDCAGGTCRALGPAALGDPCTSDDDCVHLSVQCTNYHPDSEGPAGSYCLRIDGASCSSKTECDGYICETKTCRTSLDSGKQCFPDRNVCRESAAACTTYYDQREGSEITRCLLPLGHPCVDVVVENPCISTQCSAEGTCCLPDGVEPQDGPSSCCSGFVIGGECRPCIAVGQGDEGSKENCCSKASQNDQCCVGTGGNPLGASSACCSGEMDSAGYCT